jgi:hypothetical protein
MFARAVLRSPRCTFEIW